MNRKNQYIVEEKDKLAIAQNWIHQLANGINPLDGSVLKDEEIVNNVHVSRCLFYVANVLGKYAERRTKSNASRHIKFDVSVVPIDSYDYQESITLTDFARKIKMLIPETMKVISYATMADWLIQKGFLERSEPDSIGHGKKVPTEKGNEIGIYAEERDRNGTTYIVTVFRPEAQKFLIEHLEEISQTKNIKQQ